MHDKNGNPIQKGNTVIIEAVIEDTAAGEEYCNVQIGIGKDKEHGPANVQSTLWVNAKQVEVKEGS